MVGRAASAARRYIQPAYAASGNEDQDHRNDERQQTEKFGCGEADEQAALLTVSGGGVAQRAFEERTENRSEEHTSELQSLMRISYAVFCLKKKKNTHINTYTQP